MRNPQIACREVSVFSHELIVRIADVNELHSDRTLELLQRNSRCVARFAHQKHRAPTTVSEIFSDKQRGLADPIDRVEIPLDPRSAHVFGVAHTQPRDSFRSQSSFEVLNSRGGGLMVGTRCDSARVVKTHASRRALGRSIQERVGNPRQHQCISRPVTDSTGKQVQLQPAAHLR